MQETQQTASIVRSHIAKVTGHRGENFLHNYDKADEESDNDSLLQYPNEIILKNPSAEKKQISAVSEITATVASLAIDGSVEKKQIALFIFES